MLSSNVMMENHFCLMDFLIYVIQNLRISYNSHLEIWERPAKSKQHVTGQ